MHRVDRVDPGWVGVRAAIVQLFIFGHRSARLNALSGPWPAPRSAANPPLTITARTSSVHLILLSLPPHRVATSHFPHR